MPQVPYSPVPSVGPSQSATPGVSLDVSAGAFGGEVAQSVKGLGKQLERTGDEIFQRAVALQEIENDTVAKEANLELAKVAEGKHFEFKSMQGQEAVGSLTKYQGDLEAARVAIRAKLPNDAVRRRFDADSKSMVVRTGFSWAEHAATQSKKWAAGTSASRIEMSKNEVYQDPWNETLYESKIKEIDREVRGTQAGIAGWGKEQTDLAVAKDVSELTLKKIEGIARENALAGQEMLDTYRGRLVGDDIKRAEAVVSTQKRTNGSRVVADDVVRAMPKGAPLDDLLDEGQKRAEKIDPNDVTFHDAVRERIRGQFAAIQARKRDRDHANREVVEGTLMGDTPGGKVPATYEELIAFNPKAEAAFLALDKVEQRKYMKILAQSAKGDTAWSVEGLKKYQEMKGLAAEKPADFLDQDVVSLPLPWSARKELVNLQGKLKGKAEGDARVHRALQRNAAVIAAAGIDRTTDKEGYLRFVSGLQEGLNVFQAANKNRAPTPEEEGKIIQQLMQEQKDPGSWGGWLYGKKTPLWQLTIPEKEDERIKADPEWDRIGVKPTDEMRRQIYIRERFRDLFGGSAAKPTTPAPPRSK